MATSTPAVRVRPVRMLLCNIVLFPLHGFVIVYAAARVVLCLIVVHRACHHITVYRLVVVCAAVFIYYQIKCSWILSSCCHSQSAVSTR